jgi:hypothetical protein
MGLRAFHMALSAPAKIPRCSVQAVVFPTCPVAEWYSHLSAGSDALFTAVPRLWDRHQSLF